MTSWRTRCREFDFPAGDLFASRSAPLGLHQYSCALELPLLETENLRESQGRITQVMMPKASSREKLRACTNCSRAKAKCVQVDNDNDTCQRCLKNNTTCAKSDAVATKRRGKATHARVLERKLDDIMTLLTREREQEATIRSPQMLERLTFSNESPAGTSMQSSCQNQPSVPPSTQSTGIVPSESSISIVPGFDVSFLEADQVLQEYMNTMLPEFPFVPLSFKSSSDMLKEQPLLLKTIIWVCRPPPPEISAAFENWFRQHIANQTVVSMNKNIELVQAILVFLAW
ncbi:unnamed protein product [Penicillium bialowiezense]